MYGYPFADGRHNGTVRAAKPLDGVCVVAFEDGDVLEVDLSVEINH